MKIEDLGKNLRAQSDYRLRQRMAAMQRKNPSYSNLDSQNRTVILDLLKKYKDKSRRREKISAMSIRRDMYHLSKNKLKLGLSSTDVKQIRALLNSLKE